MNDEILRRKMPRLKNFDYNATGAYFITICTKNRAELLSKIVGVGVPDDPNCVELSPYGKIADKYIKQLNDFYEDISVDRYVIMPNHIHILLSLRNGSSGTPTPTAQGYVCGEDDVFLGSSRTPTPTNHEVILVDKTLMCKSNTKANSRVSKFVSTFKRFCNKEYGQNIWQRFSFDHVIRNREDYDEHVKYIYENPKNWYYDELYTK